MLGDVLVNLLCAHTDAVVTGRLLSGVIGEHVGDSVAEELHAQQECRCGEGEDHGELHRDLPLLRAPAPSSRPASLWLRRLWRLRLRLRLAPRPGCD